MDPKDGGAKSIALELNIASRDVPEAGTGLEIEHGQNCKVLSPPSLPFSSFLPLFAFFVLLCLLCRGRHEDSQHGMGQGRRALRQG